MSETPGETILANLLMTKDNIIKHTDDLIKLLESLSSEQGISKFPECLTFIHNIKEGSLLLKRETAVHLESDLTKKKLKGKHISAYLSKIRHDLRNPINSMQGYAEISLEEFQTAGEKNLEQKMKNILNAIHELLKYIDKISVTNHPSASAKVSSDDSHSDQLIVTDVEEGALIGWESPVEEFLKFKEEIPILIVDDVEENCHILKLYLNHIGYKNIQVAYNGQQALKMIDKNDFGIVLLDIDMPEMSGIEALLSIKRNPVHRNIMVMMISAADTMENTIKCIKFGAEDFLSKPFNRDLLRVRMGACVEKKWFFNKEAHYRKQLEVEKHRYEKLLNIILPPSIVHELAIANKVQTKYYQNVAVLFADVVSFTKYCDTHDLIDVENNLQQFSELCENIAIKYNLQKIKTIGDAFLATAGMLTGNENPVLDCINCASELLSSSIQTLPAKWQLRAGIDYGTVIGGIIGHRQFLFDIWGDTVNTAARIQAAADPNSILLTKEAWEQVSNISKAESIGPTLLKGKTPIELFKYIGNR